MVVRSAFGYSLQLQRGRTHDRRKAVATALLSRLLIIAVPRVTAKFAAAAIGVWRAALLDRSFFHCRRIIVKKQGVIDRHRRKKLEPI
jgi:hypothetical protein